MGSFEVSHKAISTKRAKQMRIGIALGELAYNYKIKKQIGAAREVMLAAAAAPKYTYLSALHTLVNNLSCTQPRSMV